MTEAAWTADELDRMGDAEELRIAPRRKDGTLRRAVPIWVVRVGDELYVRSFHGDSGGWYRAARATGEGHVSAGGIRKTSPSRRRRRDQRRRRCRVPRQVRALPGYVEPMVAPTARATTLTARALFARPARE